MKRYRIVATCDPYHAKFHRRPEQEALEWKGATPVKWVQDDNFYDGFTEEEAKERLLQMAYGCCYDGRHDDWQPWSEDNVLNLQKSLKEEGLKDTSSAWWKGEGVYTPEGEPVILKGETSFTDDVVTYSVEEYEVWPPKLP